MKHSTSVIDGLRRSGKLLLITMLSMSLLVTSGCGGCRKSPQQQAKKAKGDEKPKPKKKPYQSRRPYVVPTDDEDNGTQTNAVKPGHWTTVTQQMIANEEDTQVEIQSTIVDQFDRGVRIDKTPYELVSSRAAAMPKERIREFESLFYVPRDATPTLRTRVLHRRSGTTLLESTRRGSPMPAFQYYLVVLSREPDRLKFLKTLPSIESVAAFEDGGRKVLYNRVSFLQPKATSLPLPSHSLTWTSISTLLWDQIDPARVSPAQQAAMIDWLHWGGRLIVNGPGSLERLRGSFLEPYLPVDRKDAVELNASSIAEFNDAWSVPASKNAASIALKNDQVMVGVRLEPKGSGYFIDETSQLVAEGTVGRGSIVVTAFSLTDRAVTSWPSFDSFLNGCLLRRPARAFEQTSMSTSTERRVGSALGNQDPRLVSNLRYFSRDTSRYGQSSGGIQSGWSADTVSGVGGWNDTSGTAEAARSALKDAAGISIPQVGFVLRTLAVYLAVIVPVNWLFFRLIGRVEWAWVAAPVIAIGASLAVVRLAELDIGFARSRTEVATLEFHGGHSRGHLSRYNALYTSLTAQYSMAIDEADALVQPFATGKDYEPGAYDTVHKVNLRRGRTIEMDGFHVKSNSTGMVHSEQMFDLGGAFELSGDDAKGWQLKNGTTLTVNDVGVLRRENKIMQGGWIGKLRAGQTKPVHFRSLETQEQYLPEWNKVATFGGASDDGELRLRALWSVAVQHLELDQGEVRMVGWYDNESAGVKFAPAASQTRTQTLVVGHFWPERLGRPGRDENLPPEIDLDKIKVLRDQDLLRPALPDVTAPPNAPTPNAPTPNAPTEKPVGSAQSNPAPPNPAPPNPAPPNPAPPNPGPE